MAETSAPENRVFRRTLGSLFGFQEQFLTPIGASETQPKGNLRRELRCGGVHRRQKVRFASEQSGFWMQWSIFGVRWATLVAHGKSRKFRDLCTDPSKPRKRCSGTLHASQVVLGGSLERSELNLFITSSVARCGHEFGSQQPRRDAKSAENAGFFGSKQGACDTHVH